MRARDSRSGRCPAWPCASPSASWAGSLLPLRVRPPALGRALAGQARPRARRRRLQGDRLAPAREGLPRLGLGHHGRRHARGGRARVRRQARQGLPRQGGTLVDRGEPAAAWPASRSPIRGRWRSAPSRCGSGRSSAGSRAAATATRLRASIAYAYLPAASAEPGTAVEVEIFGEWVRGEVAAEPLYDPRGERLRD